MGGSKFVIAGGGMVAGYAAKQLVELGSRSGELAIVSADTSLPYERPPLSTRSAGWSYFLRTGRAGTECGILQSPAAETGKSFGEAAKPSRRVAPAATDAESRAQPGPQRLENVANMFWKVYHPFTENDGVVCRYQGRNTSSRR
jgi:hypothetical protein